MTDIETPGRYQRRVLCTECDWIWIPDTRYLAPVYAPKTDVCPACGSEHLESRVGRFRETWDSGSVIPLLRRRPRILQVQWRGSDKWEDVKR